MYPSAQARGPISDGTPLTAAAVAYNFDYWLKGGNSTTAVWLGGYAEYATAVDSSTVRVTLSKPYPAVRGYRVGALNRSGGTCGAFFAQNGPQVSCRFFQVPI